MPTTIHLPDRLLDAVDSRARELGVSRNRLIVRALERETSEPSSWSPGFLDALRGPTPATAAAVDDMLAAIRSARTSKKPVDL